MAKNSNATEVVTVYGLLEASLIEAAKLENSIQQTKEKKAGAYDGTVKAALLCIDQSKGDLASARKTFETEMSRLFENIRKNVGNLAVRINAPKMKEPDDEGRKYKVPGSISVAKSVLLKAFEAGVPFSVEEDDEGKPVARAFGAIRKELNSHREQQREAAIANLSGLDKLKHDIREALLKVANSIGGMDEQQVQAVRLGLERMAEELSALKPDAPSAGEQLAVTAEETAEAAAAETAEQTSEGASAEPAKPARRRSNGRSRQSRKAA